MLGLFEDKYADFTVKHLHEQLRKRHTYKLGYTVTRCSQMPCLNARQLTSNRAI